ncbi:hypothetical protein LVY75_06735 (plasmid) [Sinorhizobium sp. B11]
MNTGVMQCLPMFDLKRLASCSEPIRRCQPAFYNLVESDAKTTQFSDLQPAFGHADIKFPAFCEVNKEYFSAG